MKKLLASTAFALLPFGAFAADLPSRIPAAAPAPVFVAAPPTWTGFYVGVNAGYSNTDFDVSRSYSYNLAAAPFVTNLRDRGFLANGLGTDDGRFTGGVGLGYNFQVGKIVLGVEADLNYLGADASRAFLSGPTERVQIRPTPGNPNTRADDIITFGSNATASVDWLGTLRGRIGFGFDRILVYGTGGLAFGSVKASGRQVLNFDCNRDCGGDTVTTPGSATAVWAGSGSETQFGWAAGLGFEYALTSNWSMKAEYLHYDLGTVSFDNSAVDVVATDLVTRTGFGARDRLQVSGDMFRFGVNYRFGGGSSAPVIARY